MESLHEDFRDFPYPATQYCARVNSKSGFSLVELLLVVGIVGLMLWVMIPIGLRTRTDAAYGVVRQNCSELASYTSQWAERSVMAQDEQRSYATLADYYGSLAGLYGAPEIGPTPGEWVASGPAPSSWCRRHDRHHSITTRNIDGRYMNGKRSTAPETTVAEMVPASNPIINPFTNVSIFDSIHYPKPVADGGNGPVPGAIAFGGFREKAGEWVTYGFVFQGKLNAGTELNGEDTFLPGMNLHTISGLRNGVFVARLR